MNKQDFYYDLPEELIAQHPLKDRAGSRLLTLCKTTGGVGHGNFTDILDILRPEDVLVVNNTKVIPARLVGARADDPAKAVEILLLADKADGLWEVIVKPGKWAREGHKLTFGADGMLSGEIATVNEDGNRLIKFTYNYNGTFEEVLDKLGEMPLPPYITAKLEDKDRYQTVYAAEPGSAAAPTAGLHFTEGLMEKIAQKGVKMAHVTLHVGLGTFRPVKTNNIEDHEMHSEFFVLDPKQAEIINNARKGGGRIVAVGTTTVRTLESCVDGLGVLHPDSGYTNKFIYPGYAFNAIDALITNFHLPESTLIMLVSALAGRQATLAAYQEAVDHKYRFFSFGDAMLVF
ncbi:MAG: tRNA preQ1(34) S-adenosylmethionine ribosyltransferase-isomerase QueA [Defluviitaleaceae bacterium]|nr:tRNA preQ1(34) S-adenosylmethionine ribosyltransferase-isomerase QueA [Defluviitaleaceae bacterium]